MGMGTISAVESRPLHNVVPSVEEDPGRACVSDWGVVTVYGLTLRKQHAFVVNINPVVSLRRRFSK